MKQTFVNNIQELMTANENQRSKISYLEREMRNREDYIEGLKESLNLNKQTLLVLNTEGPNLKSLQFATKENAKLIELNARLYAENRQLSAINLMDNQLRTEDKDFYLERIGEFESRISDLRKYLHDKEDTFSNVASRLKKLQECNIKLDIDKFDDGTGSSKLINEIIAKLVAQRNILRVKLNKTIPLAHRYELLERSLDRNPSNFAKLTQTFASLREENQQAKSEKGQEVLINSKNLQKLPKNADQKQLSKKASFIGASDINKQLLRLLKKEKINNQIYEDALHSAIEKNQQLLKINENLQKALEYSEKQLQRVIAQNNYLKNQHKSFSKGYGKKYDFTRVREENDEPNFVDLMRINFALKNEEEDPMDKTAYRKLLNEGLREEVEMILKASSNTTDFELCKIECSLEEKQTEMTTNDFTKLTHQIRKQEQKIKDENLSGSENDSKNHPKKIMVKSASQPRFIFDFEEMYESEGSSEDEEMSSDGMEIDEI